MKTNSQILNGLVPVRRARKMHCVDGRAGCYQLRRARENGMLVGVYYNSDAGLDTDEPWSTVCEKHGHIVSHDSLRLALGHATNPMGWCETCMELAQEMDRAK